MTNESVTINSDFWVGIVEDNKNDPLKIGQCRVRIIGLHSFDATELPTEGLPWAIPTLSLNGTKSFSVPNINDWVFGYFMDGNNKQMPVILGIIPGLVNNNVYTKVTGEQQREHNEKVLSQPQSIPTVEVTPQQGQPTTPATARGIVENTSIQTTNELRAHACDISFYVNKEIAGAKSKVREIVSTIRNGIIAALKSLGISPGTSALKGFIEDIRKSLRSINNFLSKTIKEIAKVVEVVRQIRAVIDYILSLPVRLQQFFANCLNQLYSTLSRAAFQIVVGGFDEGVGDSPISISQEVSDILNETKQLLTNAAQIYSAPYQIASALVTPSGRNLNDQQVKDIFQNSFDGYSDFKQENYLPALQ